MELYKKGTYAIHKETRKPTTIANGIKGHLYECPDCDLDVIFRHGPIRKSHFCHKGHTLCTTYGNESDIHMNAKQLLQNIIEERKTQIEISRVCIECKNQFLWDFNILSENSRVEQEYGFIYNGHNRTADIACVTKTPENIECIFEICNTHKTAEEKRPEPWFEFDASDLCDKLQQVSINNSLVLNCIRDRFTQGNESYGYCNECDFEIAEKDKGKIYFNQRGAGCGKTYESIQLIKGESFKTKRTFIYLTKMRSAKDVIFAEFESQIQRGVFLGYKVLQKENTGNQYAIILQNPDKILIKIIIGTIDSFTYAIRNKNKIFSGGSDFFQKLVKDIRDGDMTDDVDGTVAYASTRIKLTKDCLVIIDEGQDLEKEYIEAFQKIIDRTGIDTYIIGDKLQSILSEKNLFTHLEDSKETSRIIKTTGKNIIKRCHNSQFISLINSTVCFDKYNLPEVEGICSNPNCEFIHEDSIKPYYVDTGFKNIFYIKPDEINSCIDRILQDMRYKIAKHGYLPHHFMFIFPVVSEKNQLLALLNPAIQQFWVDFFSKPESYTEVVIENMKKKDQETGTQFWESKIENKENDTRYYQFVFWHRSETNQPINLNESINSSRILSIHASKGNGCECVYLLGICEFTLACHTGGISNTLVYNSLFHVGMTRQKKYLYIGIDGSAKDDICSRFGSYLEDSREIEPYIKNISPTIRLKQTVSDLLQDPFIDNIKKNILNYEDYRHILPENCHKELVDWGHHIFRFCTMKVSIDTYLYNTGCKQQQAKILSLINPKNTSIVYSDYKTYKKQLKELQDAISKNIENNKKKINENQKEKDYNRECLTVPILIFYDDRSKTDYMRYRNIIKSFMTRLLEKLRGERLMLCPIECLLYCHLMEMIQHPYNVQISIMDVYRIISCYDDCYIDDSDHNNNYKCNCAECFSGKSRGFAQPHQEIQKSIINHYKSMERMKTILENYNYQIIELLNKEPITYNVDKTITYGREEFDFHARFHYIGFSKNYVIFMIITPQFNMMNFYEILTECIVRYFILTNMTTEKNDYSNKKIYVSIITLDTDEPITIDLSEFFADKLENIKSLFQEYFMEHYFKEHNKICKFFNYHKCQKEKLKITDKTHLLYVCDIMEKKETIQINNKPVQKRIYPLPDYITNCFKEMNKLYKRDKKKQNEFDTNKNEILLKELDASLKDAVENFLGIVENEIEE